MTSQIQNAKTTGRGLVFAQNCSTQRQFRNPATYNNTQVNIKCANVGRRQQTLKVAATSTPTAPRKQVLQVQSKSGPMKVMIAGAPAAGKGTQCAEIIQKYGLVHISVGDLLRAEVKAGTPAGNKAKSFMDAGQLVPDEVVVEMVVSRMNQDDVKKNGWLLDGYPRSQSQAAAIEKENIRPDVFLVIDVPDELLIERVVGRRLDPETGDIYHMTFKPPPAEIVERLTQRSDDTEEKARTRLQVYKDNNASVVQYYTKEIVTINGDKDIKEVSQDVFKILDAVQV
eukprot:TRINITY_DN18798_c1_g1_i1.p2 TRINITY_DN18798_c1_g1~~TRINITY_DN18798_c1_g1_i1.p2  ORF type:complete len:284 (-),score=47.39 TRINITY_DN18798_c1_g1_i1:317-1168(-)